MTLLQNRVLILSILASFVVFLDSSVITVALPAIVKELGGGLVAQQLIIDAYLITLGSLILVAGSMSDLFGRKRILLLGLIGFAVTSLLCAIAPTDTFLIISRALQGIAGALLVPSSLALIVSVFSGSSTGKAIGSWTAWTGIAFVVGPLLGGLLVDIGSWRLIFAINIVPILASIMILHGLNLKEHKGSARLDIIGAALCTVGLASLVYALIEQNNLGWSDPGIIGTLSAGVISLITFVWHERRTEFPMLPLHLFNAQNFSVGNIATAAVYAGLSIATFVIAIFVQEVGQYSALQAGLALLPVTLIMFFLASRFGALADKYGPRLFMGVGPVVSGLGLLFMLIADSSAHYLTQILPGVLIFGIGLSATVAPLTAAVLSSVPKQTSGIGSAVNNAVSRIGGLVAIALLGIVIGPHLDINAFHRSLIVGAGLLFAGGIISLFGITNKKTN